MKLNADGKIPEDVMLSLQTKLGSLQDALLKEDPLMPNHLREIHRLLITYPESTHLLDDSEIAQLIVSAEKFTLTRIVSDSAKGKSSGKKAKIDASDL
jgi:hypothetical protein